MKDEKRITITVFRSNKYIYAQAIQDGNIIASDSSIKHLKEAKSNKSQQAKLVGLELAKKLLKKDIKQAIYDRKKYAYHGRVKSLADGLREGGIEI